MKVGLLLLAGLCLVQGFNIPTKNADTTFLLKQKNIYELFWHVDQPTVYHPELHLKARSFSIEDYIDSYTDKAAVTEFLQRWKHGMLPRGEVFSTMYPQHTKEVISLFKVLYTAKDFETFYNTAVWARFNVNESMYIYALTVAILHRPDTKYIRLPPLYEIVPHYYFNEDVLQKAYRVVMGETAAMKTIGNVDYHIIHSNYTGWHLMRDDMSQEKLSYFIEDVGLNAYNFLFNHNFPIWMSSTQYNLTKNIRGEMYLFGHKQLLTRYYLERLSNNMGEIENVDWNQPITTGYYPMMHYPNGLPFPQRETDAVIPLHMQNYVQQAKELQMRIANVVDSGYILGTNGKHINIYTPEGLNLLGNIIQGNADSLNKMLYGQFDQLSRKILGFSTQSDSKYQVIPSALEIYSTSLRDPVVYSMYKTIVNYILKYKAHLPCYTQEELGFQGVVVESVAVDKLMTYFDHFESMLNNAVSVRGHKEAQSTVIKARQHRLNHKPFTYHIGIQSDKITKAVVRVFLGPKYNVHGHELDISENYMNFVQLDEWIVNLEVGTNKIERNSHESIFVVPDEVPSDVLYKKTLKAIDGVENFTYTTKVYGFPDRLMLPKGKKEGMPFKLFVHVSPFDETKAVKLETSMWGTAMMDGRPMGYPLDRPVETYNFTMSNFAFEDVRIYHKLLEELNLTL